MRPWRSGVPFTLRTGNPISYREASIIKRTDTDVFHGFPRGESWAHAIASGDNASANEGRGEAQSPSWFKPVPRPDRGGTASGRGPR